MGISNENWQENKKKKTTTNNAQKINDNANAAGNKSSRRAKCAIYLINKLNTCIIVCLYVYMSLQLVRLATHMPLSTIPRKLVATFFSAAAARNTEQKGRAKSRKRICKNMQKNAAKAVATTNLQQ